MTTDAVKTEGARGEMNPNSFAFWWPKVATAVRGSKPKTVLLDVSSFDWWGFMEGKRLPPGMWEDLFAQTAQGIGAVGYPVFLRGDLTSGKHGPMAGWKITRGTDRPTLAQRLYNICAAQLEGPAEVPATLVVRRFIELQSSFMAFHGLPIARERRYFVKDGQVVCHHPYWPVEAMQFFQPLSAPVDLDERMRMLNLESDWETVRLTRYAQALSHVLPGFWSLDFAQGRNARWYFIDAALGEDSWHPKHPAETEDGRL